MRPLVNSTYHIKLFSFRQLYCRSFADNSRLRRILLLLVPAVLILMFSGCSQAVPENAERIRKPSNTDIPIAGTWVLEKCLLDDTDDGSDASDPLIGTIVGFSQDALMYGGEIYSDISYKIKRVDLYGYFLHKNADMPEKLSTSDGDILVVNVYTSDSFLFEFIKEPEGEVIAVADDRLYSMKKLSDGLDMVQEVIKQEAVNAVLNENVAARQPLRSGILLGVRIPVKTADGLGDYRYGTYWISSENRILRPVLYADDIYLPRMDGFWKLIVEKKPGASGVEDSLRAFKVAGAEYKLTENLFQNVSVRMETKIRKAIVYVGNDYACVENTVYDQDNISDSGVAEKTLRTLPVDNLSSIDGIKISDMVGENGSMAMENAIADVLKNSGYNGIVILDDEEQQKNFALYRKTGHWFFKGRIDPDRQGQLPYMDFSLNLLPPSNMVAYDVLHVPWKEMKDKLPNATDIYTSPNKDLAVVLVRNDILIYAITGKALSAEPLGKIRMDEGSTVIMAEWGLNDYVGSWEKSFTRNNDYRTVPNELERPADNNAGENAEAAAASAGNHPE
jgi:hypothetical protein